MLILSEAPLLAWGIQTCLAGYPGLTVALRSPEGAEVGTLVAEAHPDVVIVATLRACPTLCRQLQAAQQRGWVRAVICLPAAEVGCPNVPGHHGLPLVEATPPGVRRLVSRAVAQLDDDLGKEPAPAPSPLTEREKEIGRLVVAGLSSQEIGKLLFISPRTVEKHRANIMEKLGVSNAAALTMELVYLSWEELAASFEWPVAAPEAARHQPAEDLRVA